MLQAEKQQKLILLLYDLGSQVSKAFSRHLSNGDERVQLFLGILIIVSLPGDAHSHSGGHIANTSAPQVLVQLHVQPHIARSHGLLRELPDLLHCLRCHLLEGAVTDTSNISSTSCNPHEQYQRGAHKHLARNSWYYDKVLDWMLKTTNTNCDHSHYFHFWNLIYAAPSIIEPRAQYRIQTNNIKEKSTHASWGFFLMLRRSV